ncbi:MAG: hypothetical protein NTZ35_02110 [Ignavibacteriales bacterium]|nr:hypothetical protein [Ignavibacteriales bacterium]
MARSAVTDSLQVFNISDRRALERDVLRPIVDDENFRKKTVFEGLQQDDFQTREFREVYAELQASFLSGNAPQCRTDAIAEILFEGISLNGSWSMAVERLKVHRFDRLTFQTSDLGNAERFSEECGSKVRYDHTRGEWVLWDGTKWKYDETGEVNELISGTLRGMYGDAENLATEGERKAMAKWALVSESRAKICDALTIAQSLAKIRIKSTDFDRDPWLFNVRNGILDLKANTFLPHDHRALCSSCGCCKAPRCASGCVGRNRRRKETQRIKNERPFWR